MKAVILAGGLGTRLSEETGLRPKPMIEIGGKPILWHIMKVYAAHGISDFVICCGYKGYVIKEYFANYFLHMSDVTFDMSINAMEVHQKNAEPWKVTLVDTGEATQTGGRLKRVAPYVANEECFAFTYGDGVADVDITAQIAFHKAHGQIATVTAVQPPGRYGALELAEGHVMRFREKPRGDGAFINGGFFLLSPKVLGDIEGDQTSFEGEVLQSIAARGELMAFEHFGFWQAMDTLRDKVVLEELWGIRPRALAYMVEPPLIANVDPVFWRGRRVLLTGHTGFKGGWLTLWLTSMGARVFGVALSPNTVPSLCEAAGVPERVVGSLIDIRVREPIAEVMAATSPEIVFHLAAQPLVRASYRHPAETYASNVMGTIHVLEAMRGSVRPRVAVMITTDKVYEDEKQQQAHIETDRLGGYDPYASSKAACEMAIASYRSSFLAQQGTAVASVRAGNVIGGGDWSEDRLIPDAVRAWGCGKHLEIRRPDAVRPWQHVLEPLHGYLVLAQRLWSAPDLAEAYNIGPPADDAASVRTLIEAARDHYGCGETRFALEDAGPYETPYLALDASKASRILGIRPRWNLATAIRRTMDWYREFDAGASAADLCAADIAAYERMT